MAFYVFDLCPPCIYKFSGCFSSLTSAAAVNTRPGMKASHLLADPSAPVPPRRRSGRGSANAHQQHRHATKCGQLCKHTEQQQLNSIPFASLLSSSYCCCKSLVWNNALHCIWLCGFCPPPRKTQFFKLTASLYADEVVKVECQLAAEI